MLLLNFHWQLGEYSVVALAPSSGHKGVIQKVNNLVEYDQPPYRCVIITSYSYNYRVRPFVGLFLNPI